MAQQTAANSYPVVIASDQTLTVTGGGGDASAANQLTQITSLQLIDDTVATTGSAITAKGQAVAGTDGTNARILKTDSSGELQIDVLTITAGETHIGEIGTGDAVIDVTFTTDTNAYVANDVLADTQAITSAGRKNAGIVVLQSFTLTDIDDQKQPLTVVFLDTNTSLGTENGAANIDDTNVLKVVGWFKILASDYLDLGGASVACKTGIGLQMACAASTTTLYVGLITDGTPTHSATGLSGKFAFLRS